MKQDVASDLLHIANYFGFAKLKYLVGDWLEASFISRSLNSFQGNVKVENALKSLVIARKFALPGLANESMDVIALSPIECVDLKVSILPSS